MPNHFLLLEVRSLATAFVVGATVVLGACSGGSTSGDGKAGSDGKPLFYNGVSIFSKVDADPQQLLGMTGENLNEKLGQPALVRKDGDAEIWQYRADQCVLDLFLYGSMGQVEHVDLRDRGDASEEAVTACFIGILEARGAKS